MSDLSARDCAAHLQVPLPAANAQVLTPWIMPLIAKPAHNGIQKYNKFFSFLTDLRLTQVFYCTVHTPCIYDPNVGSETRAARALFPIQTLGRKLALHAHCFWPVHIFDFLYFLFFYLTILSLFFYFLLFSEFLKIIFTYFIDCRTQKLFPTGDKNVLTQHLVRMGTWEMQYIKFWSGNLKGIRHMGLIVA
jgi:hypothetical protein